MKAESQVAPPAVVFPGEAWQAATPESQGMDPALVRAAVEHVGAVSGTTGTDEMVIVRNGYVVWQGPQADRRHLVWSCTKSFLSTCFGLLWDDGKLAPDRLAKDFFPELAARYPEVTLEHLATFTSGYAFRESPLVPAEPMHAPGAALHYSQQSDLLAAILTRLAGRPLAALFAERIGTPIGITADAMEWKVFAQDRGLDVNGGSGLPEGGVYINALAMARFGWLYANGGEWRGRPLISRRYIDYATVARTSPQTPPHDPKAWYVNLPGNYGLNWWTNGVKPDGRRLWPHAPVRTFAAQGNRNNNCFIIPEWRLVVVRMGDDAIVDMGLYDRMFELLGQSLQRAGG